MRMMRASRGAVLTALLATSVAVWAQAKASVVVAVTDDSGAVVPGVHIGVTGGRQAESNFVTDQAGRATLQLSPGEYRLHLAHPGFLSADRNVEVQSQPQTVALILRPAEPSTPWDPGMQPNTYLVIVGEGGERGVFTPATLKDYPHVTVTIFNHRINKKETYSGVPLMDLLAKLGVPHGNTLRSKALAEYIVATGSDGYKSVVALGEADPTFHPGVVLVADTLDGQPLGAATGPFRLVVSEDKRPARSVRNLVEIEVKSAE